MRMIVANYHCSVPGKSKGGSSMQSASATSLHSSSSGLTALQNMAMGSVPSKDSLNALLAQTMQADPQTFLKQQQKMMQSLPASQRKAYEVMLADMKQAVEMSSKYNSHDVKVKKWLAEQNAAFNEQLNMDYRRSSRSAGGQATMPKASPQQSQPQQQQPPPSGPPSLTGDEPVPVINKQTGKRLTGNKAPQLKRLMQWLTENPAWLEHMQNPMSAPSPKQNPMDTSGFGGGGNSKDHGGRPSSTSSNASTSSHSQQQQQQQQKNIPTSSASSAAGNSAFPFLFHNPGLLYPPLGLGGLNPYSLVL